jgi:hypothetical protein
LKQYCRYCNYLQAGNGIWCEFKRKEVSESYAKHTNNCKDFLLNPIDAFAENQNEYKPRERPQKRRTNSNTEFEQLSFDDLTEV